MAQLKKISAEGRVYYELRRIKKDIEGLMQIIAAERKVEDCDRRRNKDDWRPKFDKLLEECKVKERKKTLTVNRHRRSR